VSFEEEFVCKCRTQKPLTSEILNCLSWCIQYMKIVRATYGKTQTLCVKPEQYHHYTITHLQTGGVREQRWRYDLELDDEKARQYVLKYFMDSVDSSVSAWCDNLNHQTHQLSCLLSSHTYPNPNFCRNRITLSFLILLEC
jgi:hypothetical protein